MINILYLHGGADLYGADIILLQLLKGIDRNKYSPFVILPNDGPLVQELRNIDVEVQILDYPILRRKFFNPKGMLQYFLSFRGAASEIIKFCRAKNINFIHTNTSAVLEGAYISRRLKIKHLWHSHEIITRPKAIFKFLSFVMAKYSDIVIAVSEAVKEHMESSNYFSKDHIKVIYNGVDNSRFKPENDTDYLREEFGIDKKDIVVGMLGRVNAHKGQGDFVKAMNLVFEENSKVKALISGGVFSGEEWRMEQLKKQAAESKYSSNIIIEDFRKDSENLQSLIDIYVLPSVQLDSLPTVILEAMASGKPVVAYKQGGAAEMVVDGYNGFFAELGNVEELAEKIKTLVNNKELRLKMGVNSLARQKEHFSMDSFIKNFEKTYDELMG